MIARAKMPIFGLTYPGSDPRHTFTSFSSLLLPRCSSTQHADWECRALWSNFCRFRMEQFSSRGLSAFAVSTVPGQLLNREQPFSQLPFNIEDENDDWPPDDPERFLSLGGYSFDGSEVCIDRGDSRIYLFQRDEEALASSPSASWRSLEEWITSEISRLSFLFSHDGHRLAAESQTLPVRGLPC